MVAALQIGDYPLERFFIVVAPLSLIVKKLDRLLSGTVEDNFLLLFGELGKGAADIKLVVGCQSFQQCLIIISGPAVPGDNRSITEGKFGIGNHLFVIKIHFCPETTAFRTSTVGIVEGKHPW